MSVVFDPADNTVFTNNSVFHIIQIVMALGNLFRDALFYHLHIFAADHASEGIAGMMPELFQRTASENPEHSFVGIDDLFITACMVDQETAGHLVHESDDRTDRIQSCVIQGNRTLYLFQILRQKINVDVILLGNIQHHQHMFD